MRAHALAWLVCALLIARTANAKTPDEIISEAKLGTTVCLSFVDQTAVAYRGERWLAAIRKMPKEFVLDWITGREAPPSMAIDEAKMQRDCLIQNAATDAANGAPLIEGAGVPATPAGMISLRKRAKASPQKVARNLIRSHYRGAATQSAIWRRKFIFSGRAFNVVSRASAKRCGLIAGESWKPFSKKHQTCWYGMDKKTREQEILLASSAPGTSRHHWGTDFDIFGLNPRKFFPGERLYDEYTWMVEHAIGLGMIQPYTATSQVDGLGYIEERWHWSYAPIANALLEYARENETALDAALNEQWDAFSKRWGKKRGPYFDYVRQNWRSFVFNVSKTRND